MASMAKIQIIGNVGRDPEQRYSQSGAMVVSFSVAVNDRRRQPDGSFAESTEWYRVRAFGRLAEVCQQYVTKGSPIYVDGRLSVERWTGNDGQPRYTLDVFANDVQFLGSRQPREGGAELVEASGPRSAPSSNRPSSDLDASDLEDLPF